MAAAADPSSTTAQSAHFGRSRRNLSSPWSHVVRGEHEPASPSSPPPPSPPAAAAAPILPPEASDRTSPGAGAGAGASDDKPAAVTPGAAEAPVQGEHGGSGGATAALLREKKTAWGRPSNGLAEVEPVMGAVSWPALSEATKASPKSSSSDSMKGFSDGSVFAPPAPLVTSPSSKPAANIYNSSANHAPPGRQNSAKRGGGSGIGTAIASKGGVGLPNCRSVPPVMPPTPAESLQNLQSKLVNPEPPIRDLTNRGSGNWDHGSRGSGFPSPSHGGTEHQRSYGGNKRGNGGAGGPHHYSGNRRDQEREAYDWNHRNFGGGRDVQMQQRPQHQPRPMARPLLRPPPLASAPFITPPPRVSPFGSPIGYHDIPPPLFFAPPPPPPESLGGMSFVAPPAMFFPAPDPQLQAALAKQVEYYFSPENLCKDIYLRKQMDEEGWVPISLIAGFNRVQKLTNNIQFILDTLKTSTVVEVQGDKIRSNDWMNWSPVAVAPNPTHSSAMTNYDALAAHVSNVGLEQGNTIKNSMESGIHYELVLDSSSGELNSQHPVSHQCL